MRSLSVQRSVQFPKSIEEQIMCKDKYPRNFCTRWIKATEFIILQIFFRTHLVLKIGIITIPQFYPDKIQSCDMFKPITCEQKSFMDYNKIILIFYQRYMFYQLCIKQKGFICTHPNNNQHTSTASGNRPFHLLSMKLPKFANH